MASQELTVTLTPYEIETIALWYSSAASESNSYKRTPEGALAVSQLLDKLGIPVHEFDADGIEKLKTI